MSLRETLRFAWLGVTANKPRSALTTLGILIGVAAVIILVAVGTGSSRAVQDSISALGSNTLTVTASSGGGDGFGGGPGGGGGGPFGGGGGLFGGGGGNTSENATTTRAAELTLSDAEAIASSEEATAVAGVSPVVTPTSVSATYAGSSHDVNTFEGTTPAYLTIDNTGVEFGSAFTDSDYTERRRVALLGRSVATELGGNDVESMVGETVSFNGFQFRVLGILEEKGSTGPVDNDDRVIAPTTSVQDTLSGYGDLGSISVLATSSEEMDLATSQIQAILDVEHGVSAADRDYSINSASDLLEAATESNQTFTVLLGAVAAISLLVGGIGVMNIMLVTVTERTREIGIRKAIGARRSDIVTQFLAEAVFLSVFGGLMGVLIGLVGTRFQIVGVQPVVAPYSVVIAFGVAIGIGLVFGLYPANRAAALRPIEALRYE